MIKKNLIIKEIHVIWLRKSLSSNCWRTLWESSTIHLFHSNPMFYNINGHSTLVHTAVQNFWLALISDTLFSYVYTKTSPPSFAIETKHVFTSFPGYYLHSQDIIPGNPSHITEDCSQFLVYTPLVPGSMLKLKPVHDNFPSDTSHFQKFLSSLKRESVDYRGYSTERRKQNEKILRNTFSWWCFPSACWKPKTSKGNGGQ